MVLDEARGEPATGELVARAQGGDSAALERLIERYVASLTAFCRRLAGAGGGAHAQDLVQETLLRAVVSLGRLEDPERFEAWLLGIAANVARKGWQRALRAPLSLEAVQERAAMAHPDTDSVVVRAVWEPPESTVELAERARAIERAVNGLPEDLRRAVSLRYAEGLPYAQIAVRLGVPVSTVKWRLFDARRRLRTALGVGEQPVVARPGRGRSRIEKGTVMQVQAKSGGVERLIETAEQKIARGAAFYGHWFGKPAGVAGLTESGKEAIRRAAAEGRRFAHNYVGTEHLLVGVVADEGSPAAGVLAESGVTLAKVQDMMNRRLGKGNVPPDAEMSFVPRAETVIEMAFAEARRLEAPAVGAEHLLLGLLREGCGVASLLIESLGADVYEVRERVVVALRS